MIQSIGGMGGGMMAMQGVRPRPDPQQMFAKIDADGDGALATGELQSMADHMAEKMGDQAPTVENLMAMLDGDGDGAVSFAEFEAGRPEGPPPGGPPGGMPPGRAFDAEGQMDLSSLFGESEEDTESGYADLYAYA